MVKNAVAFDALFKPSPKLKKELRSAHLDIDPKKFIKRNLIASAYLAGAFSFMAFIFLSRVNNIFMLIMIMFPFLYVMIYFFMINTPKVYILRRDRDINKDIIFATRYLLIKIESGIPLLNALIDASKGYGVGGKFFKEIVDDINLGKPIEKALEDAIKYNTSRPFKLVLRQILNSLKTGVDVSTSLKKLLNEITKEQEIEVKAYSRKLNSLILFYLIIACVLPSLGIAMFIVIASLMNLNISVTMLFAILFFVGVVQLFFISIIKSSKPMVDI